MTDDYTRGLDEIRALRERLAHLEDIARQPRPGTMLDAIADHYSPTQAPVDPARRKLERAAHGFVPDPQSEAAVAAREANPERFDADYRAMRGSALELSLYTRGRAAAIKLGTFVPEERTEGTE